VRPGQKTQIFNSALLHAGDDSIILTHTVKPSRPIRHFGAIVADTGYQAVWFLFKGKSYDVGRFYRPDGTFTGYFVDVLEPVVWEGSDPATLRHLVDLILDLWIAPDGRFQLLDEDELEDALHRGVISRTEADTARGVANELAEAVQAGTFPPPSVTGYEVLSKKDEGHPHWGHIVR
jgi:predicted RNA-binding protein associated with RNAse of E/G family